MRGSFSFSESGNPRMFGIHFAFPPVPQLLARGDSIATVFRHAPAFYTYFHHILLSKPCSGEKRENSRSSEENVKLSDGLPAPQSPDRGVLGNRISRIFIGTPSTTETIAARFVLP